MAVPGPLEIIGLIASVLQLAGLIRHLFTRIYGMASNSWVKTSGCQQFLEFLNVVEDLVKPYTNPLWEQISAMRNIMKKLKLKLETAWSLVSGLLDANGLLRCVSAREIKKGLAESQASIHWLLSLIPTAAMSEPSVLVRIAQDGHAHRGNEDLDLTANRIGSSDQVHADEEYARALQEIEYIGSPQLSNQSIRWDIRSSYQVQESLGIGSTSHSSQSPMVNPQNTMSSDQVRADEEYARGLQEREWGSSQVEDDESLPN